jgi:putative addiction module component (TIGR02574 family)
MDQNLVDDILKLPIDKRVALAGKIWDSFSDADIPTPPAVRRELRRRLAEYRKHPETSMTQDEFRRKMNLYLKKFSKRDRRSA